MSTLLVWLIAGICAVGFVTIWFITVHTELSAKRSCLADLDEQLRLHERLYAKSRDGPHAGAAHGMVETSRMLCREASKSYNRRRNRPMNRLPALLMGFRAVDEEYREG